MAKSKVGKTVENLGDYLREQRLSAELSLRQLSEQAGVSNPYLSQIERGLRKPSAEVLQQIAKGLRISAEQLYIRAGILDPDDGVRGTVELAVLADPALTERQKNTLLDVYSSFLAQNEAGQSGKDQPAHAQASKARLKKAQPRRTQAKKAQAKKAQPKKAQAKKAQPKKQTTKATQSTKTA